MPNLIALGPTPEPALAAAIEAAGATVSPLSTAHGLIWHGEPEDFPNSLPTNIEWVQLPVAGVESWFSAGIFDRNPATRFISAAPAYGATVAEHAIALLLAGVRQLKPQAAAQDWRHEEFAPRISGLRGATVALIGGGSIGRALIPLLTAFGASAIVVSRSGATVPGAIATYPAIELHDALRAADHAIIAAPATAATRNLIGSAELALLGSRSWLINVARGSLVDTNALATAAAAGSIGGAALDVTEPEPLPAGHALWSLPNVLITPHDANPGHLRRESYAQLVTANVARFAAGQPLPGRIDSARGY